MTTKTAGLPPAATEDPSLDTPEEPAEGTAEKPLEEQNPPKHNNSEVTAEKQAFYDEYFSSERTFFNDKVLQDGYNYRIDKGLLLVSSDLFITSQTLTGLVVKEEAVNLVVKTEGGLILVVGGNKLISTDRQLEKAALLYVGKSEITDIDANSELVFFVEDGAVFRLHIASGAVDTIYTGERVQTITALSSTKAVLGLPNPQFLKLSEAQGYDAALDSGIWPVAHYFYDSASGEYRMANDNEIFPNLHLANNVLISSGGTPPGASSAIPVGLYVSDTFFNRTLPNDGVLTVTQDDEENADGSFKYKDTPGVRPCTAHSGNETRECRWYPAYNDSATCCAFGKYAYDKLWPNSTWTNTANQNVNGFINYSSFQNIPSGSYILFSNNQFSESTVTHSAIFVNADASGFTYYEANFPENNNDCRVRLSYTTYSDFINTYGYQYILRYKHPNVNHTHEWAWTYNTLKHWQVCAVCDGIQSEATHTAGTTVYYDVDTHYNRCTSYPNCQAKVQQAPHNLTVLHNDGDSHSAACSDCSFSVAGIPHTGTILTSNDNGTHIAKCVCGKVLNYSAACAFGGWNPGNYDWHYRECAGCGYRQTGGHAGSGAYYKNGDSGHYRLCGTCSRQLHSAHDNSQWHSSDSGHQKYCGTCANYYGWGGHGWTGYSNYDVTRHRRTCTTCAWPQYANHSGGTVKQYSTTQHRYQCFCGGYYGYTNHSFNSQGRCTVCNYYKGHVINVIEPEEN